MITIEDVAIILRDLSDNVHEKLDLLFDIASTNNKSFDLLYSFNDTVMNTMRTLNSELKGANDSFKMVFSTFDDLTQQIDLMTLVRDSMLETIQAFDNLINILLISGGLNTIAIIGIILYLINNKLKGK